MEDDIISTNKFSKLLGIQLLKIQEKGKRNRVKYSPVMSSPAKYQH